jgi:hypothetical protein
VSIETTALYQQMRRRAPSVPAGPRDLIGEFERLREILQDQGKYIVLTFPEYTPHDHIRHLDNLFALADRILGTDLYARLSHAELILLAFGLYAHDWGMAISDSERQSLVTGALGHSFASLPDEPSCTQEFISEANLAGISNEVAWREYLRRTHGLRSGARLRRYLEPLGSVFADAVAKIAEGHTLSLREVRDAGRYPLGLSVFGETANLAALATYVRIIDLLDIGDDRTPYALWKFVAPADPISKTEWQKHRALAPISVKADSALREVLISGRTDDPAVFAALADLRSWIDDQFAMSMAHLRMIGGRYDLDLDSRINWNIDASGFEPLTVRFECDRSEVLGLLSGELYEYDPHAFVRELLQNSVDAIDMREALLAKQGITLEGEIRIRLSSNDSGLSLEWSDNGIGMDEDVLSSYFARVGRSWYRSREASRVGKIEAISQFGVGILSCFAVSHKLTVQTRKDPQADNPRPGLIVEIPTRESHFRVRTSTSIPVGTTISLDVSPPLTTIVSKQSICAALARIGRYVRHRITIDSDGELSRCGSLGTDERLETSVRSDENAKITLLAMRGDSTETLSEASTTVTLELGSPSGDFHGHYSAVVPKIPSEVRSSVDRSVWSVGGKRVEFDDILVKTEQSLFAKGIQVGPVVETRHNREEGFSHARYTSWVNPKLLLNLRHPSYLQFNLARSSVRLKSADWLKDMWQEIARKLRNSAFNWPVANAGDAAMLIGSCALFGAVPDEGLDSLVEIGKTPLLVLRSGQGPAWKFLNQFVHGDEFVEAPFELGYAMYTMGFQGFGDTSGLTGWEGGDALFPSESLSSYSYPWLSDVVTFGSRALTQLGWRPFELRLVRPPANEPVPLVCRVWRNLGPGKCPERCPESAQTSAQSSIIHNKLYSEAPEVLRFPASIAKYAAVGSRYWNVDHSKIVKIISALSRLAERVRQQLLSADRSSIVSYLGSHSFYDYVVPSRLSGVTLAIELPNRLLDIAEEEGLGHADRLVPSDFLPGTIEKYDNPYGYDLRAWRVRGAGIGKPLDDSIEPGVPGSRPSVGR